MKQEKKEGEKENQEGREREGMKKSEIRDRDRERWKRIKNPGPERDKPWNLTQLNSFYQRSSRIETLAQHIWRGKTH